MAITLTVQAIGITTATLGVVGSTGPIQLQMSSNDRFAFAPSPIYVFANSAEINLTGLNQRAGYYVRARNGSTGEWSNITGFFTNAGTAQITNPAAVMIDLAMVVKPEPILKISGAFDAGFPPENLLVDAPSAWKVSGSVNQQLQIEHAGNSIDTIALLNTNLGDTAAVQIVAGGQILYDGPFRASANLPGRRGYHGLLRFPATSQRVIDIRLFGGAPANTFYAEYLVVGRNRATKNHAVEKTETPMPKGAIERGRSGVPDRLDGIAMRKVEFDIAMLTEQQYETVYGDLVYAENEPFLIVPNSKAGAFLHDRILFGDLKGSRIFNPNTPRFTRTFVIESLI